MNPHLPLIIGNNQQREHDEQQAQINKSKELKKATEMNVRKGSAAAPIVLPTPIMSEHQELCKKAEVHRAYKEFMDEMARN